VLKTEQISTNPQLLGTASQKVCDGAGVGAPTYESGLLGAATTQQEHIMTVTHTHSKTLTAAVGAVIATVAAPALLFLSAGTAQAVIHNLPTPRGCGGCDELNPQQDQPGYPDLRPPLSGDPGSTVGIVIEGGAPSSLNPGDTKGVVIIGG
jgi:hypothetical protein